MVIYYSLLQNFDVVLYYSFLYFRSKFKQIGKIWIGSNFVAKFNDYPCAHKKRERTGGNGGSYPMDSVYFMKETETLQFCGQKWNII